MCGYVRDVVDFFSPGIQLFQYIFTEQKYKNLLEIILWMNNEKLLFSVVKVEK